MKRPVFIVFLLACALSQAPAQERAENIIHQNQQGYLSQLFGFSVPDFFDLSLYQAVADWLGTPYRYAGTSRSGIDCSAFIRKVLLEAFGLETEGNSKRLYALTDRIARDSLRQGDLLFFRIRKRQVSHVGIYLGEGKFAHSSRSAGVTVSDLSRTYYNTRFAGAGRLMIPSHLAEY